MKRLILAIAITLCAPLCFSLPYVGAEIHVRDITMKGSYKDAFAKRAPAANFYIGHKLTNYVGIELGGHLTMTQKDSNKTAIRGFHGTFVVKYPLSKGSYWNLLGGLGLTHLKHTTHLSAKRIVLSRAAPRVIVGLEYQLDALWSWRTA